MSNTTSSSGVSASTVLGIVFVVLKLVGVIDWSWVWVLAPFWIPAALFFIVLLVFVILGSIFGFKVNRRI